MEGTGREMVDKPIAYKILKNLRNYIENLRPLQNLSNEEVVSSFVTQSAVRYGLLVSIQCVIDVGNHILSGMNFEAPNTYEEVIKNLGKARIIPTEFATSISKMAGFRNLLVHHYADVDSEIVAARLKERLDDFEKFIDYIQKYLESGS